MKYLNLLQNGIGKNVNVDGHTHPKSQITDMPTKLSQFTNDLAMGLTQTVSSTAPTSPKNGQVWIQLT